MSRTRFLEWTRRSAGHEDASVPDAVQALERELRQALAVEPSPEFASRVRSKIDERSGHRHYDWRWAAAAACGLAVALGWGLAGGQRELTPAPGGQATADVRLDPEPTSVRRPAHASPSARIDGRPAHASPSARRDEGRSRTSANQVRPQYRGAEPEVFVPLDNARALTKLLALVRSGGVNEQTLAPLAAADAPATLEVAPIVVSAIPVPSVDIELGMPQDGGRHE